MYQTSTLSNGLRVVTHHMKQRESVALGFWVGVGGRYENLLNKGAAHFIEHILFKGSEKYSCEQIKSLIEGVGGNLNAFTSEEQTCFFAKIPAQHMDQTFDVLGDIVFYPQIFPSDVEKERTVIIEEIKMYSDQPQYYVLDLLEQIVWPNHPLGQGLAGTEQSVSNLNSSNLRTFFEEHYHPGNIVVSAAGKVDHEHFVALVQKKLGLVESKPVVAYEPASKKVHGPSLKLCRRDIEQMHLALGYSAYNENHPDRYVLSLLNTILGGNMSSRLFVEVREKRGLAYSISTYMKYLHDTGLFIIRAGVDIRNVVNALDVILEVLKSVAEQGVTQEEFKCGKQYLIGQLQLGLEDTMDHMLWIGEEMLVRNRTKSLEMITEKLEAVKPEDLQRVAADIFQNQKLHVSIVGPLKKEQEYRIKDRVLLSNKAPLFESVVEDSVEIASEI